MVYFYLKSPLRAGGFFRVYSIQPAYLGLNAHTYSYTALLPVAMDKPHKWIGRMMKNRYNLESLVKQRVIKMNAGRKQRTLRLLNRHGQSNEGRMRQKGIGRAKRWRTSRAAHALPAVGYGRLRAAGSISGGRYTHDQMQEWMGETMVCQVQNNQQEVSRMPQPFGQPCLLVDEAALMHNARMLMELSGGALMAVVKHNGYGLGLERVMRTLRLCGVERFAVATGREALEALPFAEDSEILVLERFEQNQLPALLENGVGLTVWSERQLGDIAWSSRRMGILPRIHVRLATGFGVLGFDSQTFMRLAQDIAALGPKSVFAHLSHGISARQAKEACQVVEDATHTLEHLGAGRMLRHVASSEAFFALPQTRMDLSRIGTALLGRGAGEQAGLKGVCTLQAPLVDVRTIQAGDTLGYSGLRMRRARRVGVVAAGFAQGVGVARHADDGDIMHRVVHALRKPPVLFATIADTRVPVIGRISLQNLYVDLSQSDAQVGDMAHLPINPLLVPQEVARI